MTSTTNNYTNTDQMALLVDSGACGHYLDDELTPGLRDRMTNYEELHVARHIYMQATMYFWERRPEPCREPSQMRRARRIRCIYLG